MITLLPLLLLGSIAFLVGMLLWIVLRIAWTSAQMLVVSDGAPRRIPIDISDRNTPPPAPLEPLSKGLAGLGFIRLGEVETRLPGFKDAPIDWVLVSGNREVISEMTTIMPSLTAFTSSFADGAVLETGHPRGEQINRPDYISHTVTTGLEQAYRYHLDQVAKMIRQHGPVVRQQTIEQYLEGDRHFREHYYRIKTRRFDLSNIVQLLSGIYCVVILLAFLIALAGLLRVGTPARDLVEPFGMLALGLFPAYIASALSAAVVDRGSRRNSPSLKR